MNLLKPVFKNVIKAYLIGWFIGSLIWYMASKAVNTELYFFDQSLGSVLVLFLTAWLLQGFFYGLLEYVIESVFTARITFVRLQIYSIVLQLLLACILVVTVYGVLRLANVLISSTSLTEFVEGIDGLWLAFVYALIVNFTINLFRYIDLVLGKGNLIKIIKGSFYDPKETHQIFMFLDLVGSTTLAEGIGHINYSNFIKDCFDDLAIVEKYDAQVYQYVGDEAVLHWELEKGIKKQNCIKAFYAYKHKLQERSPYYLGKYGAIPEFTAGVHAGVVVVTEVGSIKREIAYHGDTINIAARLQSECRNRNEDIIVSKYIYDNIPLNAEYITRRIGNIELKGKDIGVEAYGIDRYDEF